MAQTIGQRLRELIDSDVDTASLDLLEDVTATAAELNKLDGVGAVVASGTQQATVADLTITTDLTGVDTGTDMTAAQAAQIEADLAAIATKLNAVFASLEAFGIHASS